MRKKFVIVAVLAAILINQVPAVQASNDYRASANNAKSAILIDATTGAVIFSKNPDARLPIASTTKIMTAIVVLEKNNLDDEVDVTLEATLVEPSISGLKTGKR